MTRFASRRRAETFSALVDAAASDRARSDGGTATPRHGTDADTSRLLGVVSRLRTGTQVLEPPQVRPAFRDDLRARLMSEAPTALAPLAQARAASRTTAEAPHASLVLPHRQRTRGERRVALLAAAALLVGGTAGMASAAQHALPGEALYPVKRGLEQLDARFAGSDADRGRDLLHQASTRLDEARQLSAGSPEQAPSVPGTIADFTEQAREGSGLLLDSYRRDQDENAVSQVRSSAARDLAALTALAGSAPARARPQLVDAAAAVRGIDAVAQGACPTCSSLPRLTMPKVLAASQEVERALARAGSRPLDNDHPFVAPKDLLRALGTGPGPSSSAKPGSRPSAAPTGGSSASAAPTVGSAPTPTVKAPLPTLRLPPVATPSGSPGGSGDGGLGDGLGGVLGTLLPSPSGSGLLGLG